MKQLILLFVLGLCFSSCNSVDKKPVEISRPFFGEIDQADKEFVESELEKLRYKELDSMEF